MMFLTNAQVQELQDTVIDEKITKFAALLRTQAMMFLAKEHARELRIDEKIEKFSELFPNGTEVTRELCVTHPDVFSFGLYGARLLPHGVLEAYSYKVRIAHVDYVIRLGMHDPRWRRDVSPHHFLKPGQPFIADNTQRWWMAKEIVQYYNLELALIFYETSI